jgi:curved DNA-binding protein CbpA
MHNRGEDHNVEPGMKKTLYDLLEVSPQASPEAIRAAYERLSRHYDELAASKPGGGDAVMHGKLVKDAFLTLANPALRRNYDAALQVRQAASANYVGDFDVPFWSGRKILMLALVVAIGGGYYYKTQRDAALEQARLEAQAKQAELAAKQAEADAERLRSEQAEAATRTVQEIQQRSEFERFKREADANARRIEQMEENQRRQREREEEAQRRRDQYEAQRLAERDKAAARQLDYERSMPRGVSIGGR